MALNSSGRETNRFRYALKRLTTFQINAFAACYARFDSEDEILDFLNRNPLDGQRHLVLGGGSNILFVDDFDGIVLHPLLKGIDVVEADRQHLRVRAMAGENWDDLVAFAVANGWGGIENLSLIPGSVGASAVQNIGAYGVEVNAVIDRVEAISIDDCKKVFFSPKNCGFGYRFSNFKGPWAGQFIITAVVFKLSRQPEFVLDYPGVKAAVGKMGPMNLDNVRQAIVSIRQTAGKAAVHDRQALVLVNLGGATGREILELSEQVKGAVHDMFGIELEREVLVIRQRC
ncbi:MAG: FAD-binding protein [Desulfosarcina sp.]|nr:FAD-binding protein [Desulfosarcina sp.]MBC2768250.1 FAD-binding protein [Desulfosarcina sp.]